MGLVSRLFQLVFHIGVFGPFLMGVLDSSFLILPFGNDLVVVGFVAHNPSGTPGYIISAACGSTCGAFILALASRKLGESGIRKMAGDKQYERLKQRIGNRSGIAIAIAGLSPPPFPFTTVIAAVSALNYPIWKILLFNFLARGARFTILSLLAIKFGRGIVLIAQSGPFKGSMVAFTVACVVASGFSIAHWLRKHGQKPAAAHS